MRVQRRQAGFTLVEVLIVVAIIAIIASIALPSLIRSRTNANEAAVVATLRTVVQAELQLKAQAHIDLDGNGSFEYGTLGELAGMQAVRGGTSPLAPPLLSSGLGNADASGRVRRHGYLLALYLPDAAGVGLPGTAAALPGVDPVLAANYWTCLAWPAQHGTSGHTSFFVNQQGQMLKTKAVYSGTTLVPPAGAALGGVTADRIDSDQLAIGFPGADGSTWLPVQ